MAQRVIIPLNSALAKSQRMQNWGGHCASRNKNCSPSLRVRDTYDSKESKETPAVRKAEGMRFMWLRNRAVNCKIKSSRKGIIVALKNAVSCHKRFGSYCSTMTTRKRTKIRWISSRDLSWILWIQSNSSDC